VGAARVCALARYNELVEERQARHIGEIIRERNNRGARSLAAIPNPEPHVISRAQKILHLILAGMLNALATIGRFVTLPFITTGRQVDIA
jgi:hypothetical protein